MENYLYFAEAVVETGDDGASEALCVPSSSFIGADPINATTTEFLFKDAMGGGDNVHKVKFAHTSGKNKEVMRAVMACINANPQKGQFIRVFDGETGTATTKDQFINPNLRGLGVSTVTIVEESGGSGSIIGTSGGTTLSTSYGAGAISTGSGAAGAPQYARSYMGDVIITTIKVDLMGLTVKGGNAGDAIGVGTSPAYIYKNVVSENGVIFKATLACLETGTAASGTITTDINLAWNSAATIDYDEAAGTGSEINAGATTVGSIVDSDALTSSLAITANHYAYLTEGDTTASDGTYATGQYLITLYGSKLATA
jgi:hypothetical protein